MLELAPLAVEVLASGAVGSQDPGWVQTDNIKGLLVLVASLVGALVGLTMIFLSRKGNIRKIAEMGAGALLGFVVLMGSLGAVFVSFGEEFLGWFFG